MPDIPKKFEDWTPPWKEGEFDADKAARLIFNLSHDKVSLQASNQTLTTERDEAVQARTTAEGRVAELEDKDLPEIERLRKENARLAAVPPKTEKPAGDSAEMVTARYEAAMQHGLTAAQAKRLTGTTPEEIAADAEAYAEEHGLSAGGDGNDAGERPPTRQPRGALKTGLGGEVTDPDEFDPAKQTLPPRY